MNRTVNRSLKFWMSGSPDDGGQPLAQSGPTQDQVQSSVPSKDVGAGTTPRRRRIFLIAGVVAVIAIILVAYALTDGFQFGGPSKTKILVADHTVDVIPAGQFDAVTFIISTTSIVNGTFVNSYGIVLYTMTPTQFESFIRTTVVSGYEWTSGMIENEVVYNLDLSFPPGAWDLVFLNPSPINATALGFWTSLTLTPS